MNIAKPGIASKEDTRSISLISLMFCPIYRPLIYPYYIILLPVLVLL